jgi:uncharacterized protein (TIGR02421 family)
MTDASKTAKPPVKAASGGRKSAKAINDALVEEILGRIRAGKRVRRVLPSWGRLHIDRQLPFLCVYRQPSDPPDDEAANLVTGEASYLLASGEKQQHKALSRLVLNIAEVLKEAFGSFLLLEVWVGSHGPDVSSAETRQSTFRIHLSRRDTLGMTVSAFEQALQDIHIQDETPDVEIVEAVKPCPKNFPSLITPSRAAQLGCHLMGIEINEVYRDPASGQFFPMVHKVLRRRLAAAYKKGFFDFTRRHTTHRPPHFNALGPRAMVKAVWTVDEQLANVSSSFDLLLSVTPINAEAAWSQFRRKRFEQMPEFIYRSLSMDPALLKRQLYRAPIERIEDPVLAHLFSMQQLDLDRKISLLARRGSPEFVLSSQQLYGPIYAELVNTALEILELPATREREDSVKGSLDAQSFANLAKEEIDYLKMTHPDINSRIQVRKDIVGLMVSRGNLLISSRLKMPPQRAPAAIAHEVGTHIVTYINGLAQPFRQLSAGLPGYEELQEGLAVFAEYLVGGLTLPRLRMLAISAKSASCVVMVLAV